ncbi:HetZ-related protein 2 [Iningainema tapete]|uniref:HetZ-related protein 2 n=1 Tax=Iningainema tapete BLCC-T55 TaxID=2748662 RepID=A0A8J6XS14_9CYAN|nr:HetZ-related protein 2 [Iningainema tapete]MBD2775537.1 HetZ-related protein 2 [Iningainema tapete BLCC-T55]
MNSAQAYIAVANGGYSVSTIKQGIEERNLTMTPEAEKLAQYWRSQLMVDCPELGEANRESIVLWLLGSDSDRLEQLEPKELDIAIHAMGYRWRILNQRYLGKSKERAYRNLITRLGSLVTLRNKIQTWVALSRDRQRSVMDVLVEVIQELLQSDNYMQQQMSYIASFTSDKRLQNALLFASIEEYCLRPVRNQPLIAYRFVNFLRRTQRGGLTQVPTSDNVKLISEEILTDDSDNRVNLVDSQAIAEYSEVIEAQEQLEQRHAVKQEFENYLLANLGQEAVEWLQLYLQGKSQDEIAKKLNKPIKEIYRLREKISYHAVRVFAVKGGPELVENWLSISIREHNLGLTPKQFDFLQEKLTITQRQVLSMLKASQTVDAIASHLKLKTHQVIGELTKIYLVAQALRTQQ